MKNLFLFLSLFICVSSFAQSKQYIRADSVYIQRDNGNGELILLNATRDSTGGLLTNMGRGRTSFVKAPTDFRYFFDNEANPTVRDTSFTDDFGNAHLKYNLIVLPQFVGRRIRVSEGLGPMPEDDQRYGTWYSWDIVTGKLSLYPVRECPSDFGGCGYQIYVQAY